MTHPITPGGVRQLCKWSATRLWTATFPIGAADIRRNLPEFQIRDIPDKFHLQIIKKLWNIGPCLLLQVYAKIGELLKNIIIQQNHKMFPIPDQWIEDLFLLIIIISYFL